MAGYSDKPLSQKLGIHAGSRIRTVGAPADYRELLGPLPPDVLISPRLRKHVDIVHLFVTSHAGLAARLRDALPVLRRDGMIWVSWPKKASGVPSDMSEDEVRRAALPLGLVDVKVCAVDETWSGLKLVVRKALRQ